MPLSGNGDQDDAPFINDLISGTDAGEAGGLGIVEIPHTGIGWYECETPIIVPDRVHLRPAKSASATPYYGFLHANRTGHVIELDDSTGNPGHCRAIIEGFSIINAGSGGAISSAGNLFQGQIRQCEVSGGIDGPAVDLAAQDALIDGLRVSQSGDGGLLGNALLEIRGNDNELRRINVRTGSIRSNIVSGTALVRLRGYNGSFSGYLEPTIPDTKNLYLIDIDELDLGGGNFQPSAFSILGTGPHFEPNFTGSGALTNGYPVVVRKSVLTAYNIGFLGGAYGKLRIDVDSQVDLRFIDLAGALEEVISIDDSSCLTVERVATLGGGGWRDKPNVNVKHFWYRAQHGGTPALVENTREVHPANRAPAAISGSTSWTIATAGGAAYTNNNEAGRAVDLTVTDIGTFPGGTITVTVTPVGVFNRAQWRVDVPAGVTYIAEDQDGNNYVATETGSLTPPQKTPADTSSVIKFTFSNLALGDITIDKLRAWQEE